MQQFAEVALLTERALLSDCLALTEQDPVVGKTLLARDASVPFSARCLALQACDSDDLWALYEDHRLPVEREFGLDDQAARH